MSRQRPVVAEQVGNGQLDRRDRDAKSEPVWGHVTFDLAVAETKTRSAESFDESVECPIVVKQSVRVGEDRPEHQSVIGPQETVERLAVVDRRQRVDRVVGEIVGDRLAATKAVVVLERPLQPACDLALGHASH